MAVERMGNWLSQPPMFPATGVRVSMPVRARYIRVELLRVHSEELRGLFSVMRVLVQASCFIRHRRPNMIA